MADMADQCERIVAPDDLVNPADIRLAAMNLLARREHSVRELKRKLAGRFPDEAQVDEVLLCLAEENLQSDTRFAESFLRQRAGRGYGPSRIRQEMRERGIPDNDIQMAMTTEAQDWSANARRVLERKFGLEPARDIKEKARRSRFMQYRGFSHEHFGDLI